MDRYFRIGFLCFWSILQGFSSSALSKRQFTEILEKSKFDIPIRVLLEEKAVDDKPVWKIEATAGCLVIPREGKKVLYKTPELSLSSSLQALTINDKSFSSDHLCIIPLEGCLSYKGRTYAGIFSYTKMNDKLHLVNHVDLEEYVASIVPSESWPGWPDEVNKAFCIGFRSYGIAKIFEHRTRSRKGVPLPYDVKNTRVHQVYKGCAQSEKFKKLAQETKGIVLAHKNKPIVAMFDICCGGIIPSRKKGLNFTHAPYLARPYACTYCKDYKFYRWQCTYTSEELIARLKKEFPRLEAIKDIKISRKDGAGIVQEIRIRGSRNWFTVPGTKFKSLVKGLRSLCFTVQKRGSQVTIQGKGFGHLVGLCQWGAYSMVVKGWTYKNILKYYCPHTSFMKLTKLTRGTTLNAKL